MRQSPKNHHARERKPGDLGGVATTRPMRGSSLIGVFASRSGVAKGVVTRWVSLLCRDMGRESISPRCQGGVSHWPTGVSRLGGLTMEYGIYSNRVPFPLVTKLC